MTPGEKSRLVVEEGQELHGFRKTVSQEQINLYARASGDGNPIHLDPEFAAQGPFGCIVAHGMLTLGFVSELMTRSFGRHWAEGGGMKVRFRAPAYPGEELIIFGQVTGLAKVEGGRLAKCTVGCRKVDGQEVVTGEASVTLPDA